jgi:hypothetical protein
MVPSRRPCLIAATSSAVRSGGFILAICIVPPHRLFGQREVVGTGLCRHPDTALFCLADHPDRPGGAHVTDMEARACQLCQCQVPADHHILCGVRDAAEPQFGRDESFVHDAFFRKARFLAVGKERQAESFRILHGPPHDAGAPDRPAVIRDADTTGMEHSPISEVPRPSTLGDGPMG